MVGWVLTIHPTALKKERINTTMRRNIRLITIRDNAHSIVKHINNTVTITSFMVTPRTDNHISIDMDFSGTDLEFSKLIKHIRRYENRLLERMENNGELPQDKDWVYSLQY